MNAAPNSYRDLHVWQKAVLLAEAVYAMTDKFPKEEIYGLTSQMRRSAVSIASNIAEGSRRNSRKDFRKFTCDAFGSGAELETQIIITKRLPFGKQLNFDRIDTLLDEVMKMLNALIRKLA